jgi:hypothetical protein
MLAVVDRIRAIPNVEYHAPWFMDTRRCQKTLPYERWEELSEQGRHLCRFISLQKGETPPQLQGEKPNPAAGYAGPKL